MISLDKLKKTPIYYIVGIGRSGTSMVTSLFHPNCKVWASPENPFLLFFYHAYCHKTQWTANDIEAVITYLRLIFETHPPIGWHFDPDALRQTLLGLPEGTNYAEFCKAIYFNFLPAAYDKNPEEVQFILDKNPSYTLQWRRLLQLNPLQVPKFLVMLRDYRANILSRKQSINVRKPQTAFDAYRWLLFNRAAQSLLKKHPDLAILVRYEDMVMQPEEESKRVCAFFGVPYAPDMLQFHRREKKVYDDSGENVAKSARFQKKYGDLARPINTSRLEAWKTQLSERDRLVAEYVCGKMGRQFGYETTLDIGLWQRIGLFFTTFIPFLRAFYDVYKDECLFYLSPKLKMSRIKWLNKTIKHEPAQQHN